MASVVRGAVCVCCPGGAGGRANMVSPPESPTNGPSLSVQKGTPHVCTWAWV